MFSWLFSKRSIDKELKEFLKNGININVNVNIIGDANAKERRDTVEERSQFAPTPSGSESTGEVGDKKHTPTGIQNINEVPDFGKFKGPEVKFGDEQ